MWKHGTGGMHELKASIEQGKILFGGFRVVGVDPRGNLVQRRSKYVKFSLSTQGCPPFLRAKAGRQDRQEHAGPALLGTDRDLGHVLATGRAGRFSLMNLGMNYSKRKRDGLWTPCTNVAFVMCGLRGWLPGQGGVPRLYLATPGRNLMRRCRPCAECKPQLHWDECFIVRSEYCMLERYCANGNEIWDAMGNWTCVPRRHSSASTSRRALR